VTHLLDTNSCVSHLRLGTGSKVANRLAAAPAGCVGLCSVVVAELLYGAYRSANPTKTRSEVLTFCSQFISLPFDDSSAEEFGKLRDHLSRAGLMIGPYDLMIAATALAHRLTLVARNTSEFSRVPGLNLEDWQ
jgi:tRNA(fMet)-specific endonuclease VapC